MDASVLDAGIDHYAVLLICTIDPVEETATGHGREHPGDYRSCGSLSRCISQCKDRAAATLAVGDDKRRSLRSHVNVGKHSVLWRTLLRNRSNVSLGPNRRFVRKPNG